MELFPIVLVLCTLLLQCVCNSGLGPCPKLNYMTNFELSKFTGHWYEIERSFYLMELISSCVNVDLEAINKERAEVFISTKSRWSGRLSISEGIAVQSRKHPSILLYKVNSELPRIINKYLPGAGFYQILTTDYDKYAVLYSCSNYELFHTDLVWIWSRKTEIDAKIRAEIYALLAKYNIDSERLILPKNKNCTDI